MSTVKTQDTENADGCKIPLQRHVMPNSDKLLTQNQVSGLADGVVVCVLWSGGNGPGEYTVQRLYGVVYVLDSYGVMIKDPLDFIGKEKINTKVWLKV